MFTNFYAFNIFTVAVTFFEYIEIFLILEESSEMFIRWNYTFFGLYGKIPANKLNLIALQVSYEILNGEDCSLIKNSLSI